MLHKNPMPSIRLNACLDATTPPRVDRAARRINGVAVMTIGEAKGHGFRLNEVSLANALKLGSDAKLGIKSRLSHPTACNDVSGKHLGRAVNFRDGGDGKLLADLQLAAASSKSPHGDLADYVMTLAEEDPAAFGLSMVVEYQRETELDAKKNPKTDASGKALQPFAIITALKAVDVVGDPAANPGGMFSEGDDSHFAKDASALLDELEAGSPEALLSRAEVFLRSYLTTRFGADAVATAFLGRRTDDQERSSLLTLERKPMTAEQQARADAIAALCTKYLGDNADSKTKAAAFTADDKVSIDGVKDALLDALLSKGTKGTEGTKVSDKSLESISSPLSLEAYKARQTEITALCVSALGDNLDARKRADAFLNDPNITTEAVRNAMFSEVCAMLKAPKPGDDPLKPGDKEAKRKAELGAEYDAHAETHAQLGVTREEYIATALADGDSPIVIVTPKNKA